MLKKYFRIRRRLGFFMFIAGLICLLLVGINAGVISKGEHRWISNTVKAIGLIAYFFFLVFSAFTFIDMWLGEINKICPTLGLILYGISLLIGYIGFKTIEPSKSSFLGDFAAGMIAIGWPLVCAIDLAVILYAEKKGA